MRLNAFVNCNQIVIILLLFDIQFSSGQKNEGDSCTVRRSGAIGVCTPINECQSVINDLKLKRFPSVCGYSGFNQIICCPDFKPTTAMPSTTTPQSTTTRVTTPRPANRARRMSYKKCLDYRRALSSQKVVALTLTGESSSVPKSTPCNFTSAIPLISGGEEAKPKEFPHMVAIGFQGDKRTNQSIIWGCGGSLISDKFVLTAAHCLRSSYGPALYAKLGQVNQVAYMTPILHIAERILHPDYKSYSYYYDIGLIRLQTRLTFNDFVRPACLDTEALLYEREKVMATGWGQRGYGQSTSKLLLKVGLEIFSNKDCNEIYDKDITLRDGIIDSFQICAGSITNDRDTCEGDSGGPLQIYHRNYDCMYSIVGITSFGKICGTPGSPGVYTRVFAYLPWIESIVWPDDDSD